MYKVEQPVAMFTGWKLVMETQHCNYLLYRWVRAKPCFWVQIQKRIDLDF